MKRLCILALLIGSLNAQTSISVGRINKTTVYADQRSGADGGAKINAADSLLGAGPGEIIVSSPLTATTQITISEGHTLRVLAPLTIASPIRLGNYARLTCSADQALAAAGELLASGNMTSMVQQLHQFDNAQEAVSVDHCAFSGQGFTFSTGVLDFTGAFIPAAITDVVIFGYAGGPGIYATNATTSDGGGPILIENVWLNPNSSARCLSLEHDGVTNLPMQGYRLHHIWCENSSNTDGAMLLKNTNLGNAYLRFVSLDQVLITGSMTTGIKIDGLQSASFNNIFLSGSASTNGILVTNSAITAFLTFSNITNSSGFTNTLVDQINSRTLTDSFITEYTLSNSVNAKTYFDAPTTFYNHLTIDGGIPSGTGFKHQRFTGVLGGTCPTAAAIGATCTSGNLNWSAAFTDNSYTVACSMGESVTGQPHIVQVVKQAAGAGITLQIAADTAAAADIAVGGELDCIAVHD